MKRKRRVREVTVKDKKFSWYVKSPKNNSPGKILVIKEKTEQPSKETTIYVGVRNIGPRIVRNKISKLVLGDKPSVESVYAK